MEVVGVQSTYTCIMVKQTAYTNTNELFSLTTFLCVTGVEVNLLTWRTLDAGLHFSLHNLTATYDLVHYTYMCLSPLIPNVHWMQLCRSRQRQSAAIPATVLSCSRTSCSRLMWGSSFQSSFQSYSYL